MGILAHIKSLVEAEIEGSEYFLVDVKSNQNETSIQIYLDGDNGVEIGYCARLSRRLSAQIDEMEEDFGAFRFEISSPGADKPLKDLRQYPKHVGRTLEVKLKDGEPWQGELLAIEGEILTFDKVVDQKKKLTEKTTINFKDIEESMVIISFNSKKK